MRIPTAPTSEPDREVLLRRLLQADEERMRILRHLAYMSLPDGWIGAGFVRSLIWDHAHGLAPKPPAGDVDVVWYGPADATDEADWLLETQLRRRAPTILWSVKNQGRMHKKNGDPPYKSTADAMTYWPETATAIGVRSGADGIEILAPFGLADLFDLVIRPTPAFVGRQTAITERMHNKRWLERWPNLRPLLAAN